MPVQDDQRELAQIELFGLFKPEGEGRSGIDAILKLDTGVEVLFELKSMTDKSVTTARDFGHDHIEKWRNKHFLISKFSKSGAAIEYSIYGGPSQMEPWLRQKELYIEPDYKISKLARNHLTLDDLYKVVGRKKVYSLTDAKALHKQQYSQTEYEEFMDEDNGYSPKRMLEILKDRCEYLLRRGSTLNNPHIPKNFIANWEQITRNHPEELRRLVKAYLERA